MVLTVETTEVAARTGKGETHGARMEVIEGLLLDGVDGEGTGLSIDVADEYAALIASATTETALAVGDVAMMRTELALDLAVLQTMIIPTIH